MLTALQQANPRLAHYMWQDVLPLSMYDVTAPLSLPLSGFILGWKGALDATVEDKGVQVGTFDTETNSLVVPRRRYPRQWTFQLLGTGYLYIGDYQPTLLAALPSICNGKCPMAYPLFANVFRVTNALFTQPLALSQSGGTFAAAGYQLLYDLRKRQLGYTDADYFVGDNPHWGIHSDNPDRASGALAAGASFTVVKTCLTNSSLRILVSLSALSANTDYAITINVVSRMTDTDGSVVSNTLTMTQRFTVSASTSVLEFEVMPAASTGNIDVTIKNDSLGAVTAAVYVARAKTTWNEPSPPYYRRDLAAVVGSYCLEYPVVFNRMGELISVLPHLEDRKMTAAHALLFGCQDCCKD